MQDHDKEAILELAERFIDIENEIKLLQDDKKQLCNEYKERLDVKTFKAALQIAKIKLRLGDSEASLGDMLSEIEKKITV